MSVAVQSQLRTRTPLSNDQIMRIAPSVFATAPRGDRSEKYGFIPTSNVLEALRNEGFAPYAVAQTRSRVQGGRDFTKHMLRLRRVGDMSVEKRAELPEIVLTNSHDGTSSYELNLGYYRLVCSNGLIAFQETNGMRVRHTGNVVGEVIEGCTRILDDIQLTDQRVDAYKGIQLNAEERNAFAETALALRWDEGASPVKAQSLLAGRRYGDMGKDLWTTFNVVQENLIRGGVAGRTSTNRRMSTRAVQGVNENVRLNKALWALTEKMAALKAQ